MRIEIRRWYWRLVGLALVAGAVVTFLSFLGRVWWPLELLSHFRVQYLAGLAALALLYLLGRRWPGLALAGLLAGLNLLPVGPLLPGRAVAQAAAELPRPGPTLRLVSMNAYWQNTDGTLAAQYVAETVPDVVLVVEARSRLLADLRAALPEYAYVYGHASDHDPAGIVLLSRQPLAEVQELYLNEADRPAIMARLWLGDRPVTLIGVHPTIPLGAGRQERRNATLAALGAWVAAQPEEVIVIGDLNISPWSPYFADLLHVGGLQDGRVGFGIYPTWPTPLPLLQIPIDHALVTSGLQVTHFASGPGVGSDHRPIVVDVAGR